MVLFVMSLFSKQNKSSYLVSYSYLCDYLKYMADIFNILYKILYIYCFVIITVMACLADSVATICAVSSMNFKV